MFYSQAEIFVDGLQGHLLPIECLAGDKTGSRLVTGAHHETGLWRCGSQTNGELHALANSSDSALH